MSEIPSDTFRPEIQITDHDALFSELTVELDEKTRELQAIDRALDPAIPGDGTTGSTRSDGSPRQHISTVGPVRLLLRAYGDLKRELGDVLNRLAQQGETDG